MLYSIVIPTWNGLQVLSQCLTAVRKYTRDYEVIVVDNGSEDGTLGFLNDLKSRLGSTLKIIRNEQNRGFAHAMNQGLEKAEGDYLVWMNNDVLVTPDWAEQLVYAMNNAMQAKKLDRVGIVGPATNFAAGRQAVTDPEGRPPRYSLARLEQFARDAHRRNEGNWHDTGFLSGFLMLMTREVYEKVGPVEDWHDFRSPGEPRTYNPGGFEDNDYVLRAWLAGYRSMIVADTFVHHFGSVTLQRFPAQKGGVANHEFFLRKWKKLLYKEHPKLVAGMRIRWTQSEAPLGTVLDAAGRFCDEIVIVDNGMSPTDRRIAAGHSKVTRIVETDGLDERRDRNLLIELARERQADWMISIDADEIFEEKFDRRYAERLMNPPVPTSLCYMFHWYTFWDSTEQWRTDGIFGRIAGPRMWRMVPGARIVGGTEPIGFHCGNVPGHPPEYLKWTSIRIKHYGYVRREERERKYEFYEKNDKDKQASLIGQQDYSHLVASEVQVARWKERNGISLVMLARNEEDLILEALRQYASFVDQMIVVDTGSTDRTKALAELMGAEIHEFQWQDDYAAARNFGTSKARHEWVWHMDPDEDIPPGGLAELRRLMEKDMAGFLFTFANIHPSGIVSMSENVRLFRRIPQLWFEGCAHESLDEAISANPRLRIGKVSFQVKHKGYLKDRARVAAKMKYYFDLNHKQLEKNPNDVRAMHAIATHLLNLGKVSEAMIWLEKADRVRPTLLVKRHLAQLFARFAWEHCRQALSGCVFVRPEDREYMKEFMRAMDQFRFVNIPVPHEGEQEVAG